MGREMEMLVFGHAGAKVLAFPTRDGRFFEYENIRVIEALRQKIEPGHLQVFCVDSVEPDGFFQRTVSPRDRIQRLIHYEEYLLTEVLPLMQSWNPHECVISFGCSLGAFQAVTFAFRHPQLIRKLAAFSGRYDFTRPVESFPDYFDGYYDEDIYFYTPLHFLPNLTGEEHLLPLRQMDIVLAVGNADPFLASNQSLSRILDSKSVPHQLHLWNGRAHQGRDWRKMCQLYL